MKVFRQTYRPQEVAIIFGIGISTVYRRIQEGRIPAVMDPRRPTEPLRPIRIPLQALHRAYPEIPLPERP